MDTVNIICMKWGRAYGPEYVNRLHAGVSRNLSRPFRFVCFTDDPTGLTEGVEAREIPTIRLDPPYHNNPWRKLGLFRSELADLSGTTLFLDLDLVVVGGLDPLFEHPGDYCVIHNWTRPKDIVGNTSVFRFEIGAHADILELFESQPTQHWVDLHANSQTFTSRNMPDITYWPPEWCVSFKRHCLPGGLKWWHMPLNALLPSRPPTGARIVVFHGHPNPDEAIEGRWPGGWYKALRPAGWIAEHWR